MLEQLGKNRQMLGQMRDDVARSGLLDTALDILDSATQLISNRASTHCAMPLSVQDLRTVCMTIELIDNAIMGSGTSCISRKATSKFTSG
jgi:hypothetical protein